MLEADSDILNVVSEPDRTRTALSPLRRRLIAALSDGPDSATGLAERLGDSRQRLNYHLRILERAGFVELAEERPRRGCVERVLRLTSRHVLIDPLALGEPRIDPDEFRDRFSAGWVIALAARAVRELARLRERAARKNKRLATLGMDVEVRLARPADFQAFAEDLTEALADVVARHHDANAPGARAFRVVAATYPRPPKENDDEGDR